MNQNPPDSPFEAPAPSVVPAVTVRPKVSTARTVIAWVALALLLLVFGPLFFVKFTEPGRALWLKVSGAEVREREASQALKDFGALVVVGPDGYTSSVNLVGKRVDADVLKSIAALSNLDNLDVANCNIGDDDLWCVAGLTQLSNLMLTGTAVTGPGLVHLKRIDGLTGLNLANTPVGDDGLAHLTGLTNLHVLDLSKTRLSDDGMKHVAAVKGIHHLLVSHTAITDDGLELLAQLKGLKRLTIANTKVTAAGLKKLQEALPGLSIDGPGREPGGPQTGPR